MLGELIQKLIIILGGREPAYAPAVVPNNVPVRPRSS